MKSLTGFSNSVIRRSTCQQIRHNHSLTHAPYNRLAPSTSTSPPKHPLPPQNETLLSSRYSHIAPAQHTSAMNFGSDNWAGAHPQISENLSRHASGFAKPYGESQLDASVEETFRRVFEKDDLKIFFVGTGTAANCLALTSMARPGGIVFCQREAHVVVDECGAPEYLSGGQIRLNLIDGPDGKIDPEKLRREVKRVGGYDVHGGRGVGVSITNPTESGTVYSLAEIDEICEIAKGAGLSVHMDGARFANCLVSLACSPADMTWKRGVDVLSFGATKNGCWAAEAVVFFDPKLAEDFMFMRKRTGQLFSKSRFIAAQFEAYFQDDLWLDIARHSNSICTALADVFEEKGMRVVGRPQANELFVVMKEADAERLEKEGVVFLQWPGEGMGVREGEVVGRFVGSFETGLESVEGVRRVLEGMGRS